MKRKSKWTKLGKLSAVLTHEWQSAATISNKAVYMTSRGVAATLRSFAKLGIVEIRKQHVRGTGHTFNLYRLTKGGEEKLEQLIND